MLEAGSLRSAYGSLRKAILGLLNGHFLAVYSRSRNRRALVCFLCVYVHACAYMCVHACICMFMHACVQRPWEDLRCPAHSVTLCLTLLRSGSPWAWSFPDSQQSPVVFSPPPPVLRLCTFMCFLHGSWGSKVRSSRLCSWHCYPLSHFPGPSLFCL